MDLLAKSDEEIFAIGKPFWENLVKILKSQGLWWFY